MNESERINELIVPEESQKISYANNANGALELETPEDGETVDQPPNGGLRAWLIVLSCVGINLFQSMIVALIRSVLTDSGGFSRDTNIANETCIQMSAKFLNMTDIYAALAAFVMIFYGYAPTVIIGAGVVMATLFFVSYLGDDETEGLIKFLLYGPTAVGVSFIRLGTLIPILEYFTTKRFRALFLSRVSLSIGDTIVNVCKTLPTLKFKWRVGLRASSALCIGIGLIGLTLKDLNLTMTNDKSVTFVQKTLGLAKKDILRNVLLWVTCVVYFFYQFGIEPAQAVITNTDLIQQISSGNNAEGIIFGFCQPIGMVIGIFSAWMFKKAALKEDSWFNRIKLMNSLWNFVFVILMINTFTIGIACFIAPYAVDFFFFFPFSLVYAIFMEFCGRMRDDIIPNQFGRGNIRFVEGLIIMAVGLGGVITNEISAKISTDGKIWKYSLLYGGGVLMFTTAVIAFVLFLKEKKAIDKITIGGAQSKVQTNTNMESNSIPWVGNADVIQEQKSPWSVGSDDKRQSNSPNQTNSSAKQNPIYDSEVLY